MPVSWLSPSAVMTPGGVTAGLSDLAQVIASAPERQYAIQRQREADQREAARFAMAEEADRRAQEEQALQMERGRFGLEQDRKAAAWDEADRAMKRQRAATDYEMGLGQRVAETGLVPQGVGPLAILGPASAKYAENKRNADLTRNVGLVEAAGRGALPTSELMPLGPAWMAQGEAAYRAGEAKRQADISRATSQAARNKALADAAGQNASIKSNLESGKLTRAMALKDYDAALKTKERLSKELMNARESRRMAELGGNADFLALTTAEVQELEGELKRTEDSLNALRSYNPEQQAAGGAGSPKATPQQISALREAVKSPNPTKAEAARKALAALGEQ